MLRGIALERIQAEVMLLLQAKLPDELVRISQAYSGYDQRIAAQLSDAELGPMNLEPPVSYFPGHKASAIGLPKEQYPIVYGMAYRSVRDALRDADQYDARLSYMYVEGIVKAETQGVVNRAVQRYAEAVHNVVSDSGNVNGIVHEVPVPEITIYDEQDRPSGGATSDGFVDGSGDVWWWQGFRLEWAFPTMHTFGGRQTKPLPADGLEDAALPAGTF